MQEKGIVCLNLCNWKVGMYRYLTEQRKRALSPTTLFKTKNHAGKRHRLSELMQLKSRYRYVPVSYRTTKEGTVPYKFIHNQKTCRKKALFVWTYTTEKLVCVYSVKQPIVRPSIREQVKFLFPVLRGKWQGNQTQISGMRAHRIHPPPPHQQLSFG